MPLVELVSLAQTALYLAVLVSLPVLVATALVGIVTSIFQAATQVQDASLSHLPRLLVAALVLAAFGPWMGRQIADFARHVFGVG